VRLNEFSDVDLVAGPVYLTDLCVVTPAAIPVPSESRGTALGSGPPRPSLEAAANLPLLALRRTHPRSTCFHLSPIKPPSLPAKTAPACTHQPIPCTEEEENDFGRLLGDVEELKTRLSLAVLLLSVISPMAFRSRAWPSLAPPCRHPAAVGLAVVRALFWPCLFFRNIAVACRGLVCPRPRTGLVRRAHPSPLSLWLCGFPLPRRPGHSLSLAHAGSVSEAVVSLSLRACPQRKPGKVLFRRAPCLPRCYNSNRVDPLPDTCSSVRVLPCSDGAFPACPALFSVTNYTTQCVLV